MDWETKLSGLPERHSLALRWFAKNSGTEQPWPHPLPSRTLLASKAKGIYKPHWSDYALSVRHSLKTLYKERVPEFLPNGYWFYRYFQENQDVSKRDLEYTNRGLIKCMHEGVPVGVLVQVSGKPRIRYFIFGLGLVESWQDGYFKIVGMTPIQSIPDVIRERARDNS